MTITMTTAATRTVMIIDDSASLRRLLRRVVTDLGMDTLEAGHGQEALDLLEAGRIPDLCLVDWNMPVMDGYTFVTRVRAVPGWRHVTLMMVTHEGGPDRIVRALVAGAHDYVVKPFTTEAIVERLQVLGLVTSPAVVP